MSSRRHLARLHQAALCCLCFCVSCAQESSPDLSLPGVETSPFTPTAVRFRDGTAASGLNFVHEVGASGAKLLPETMGSGALFADFNGDGLLDVFAVNAGSWPDGGAGTKEAPSRLWLGRGDATFEEVTQAFGADLVLYGMGASAADYDGDGDLDLFVTGLAGQHLLANQGTTFVDVTAEAGLSGGHWLDREGKPHAEWSTASAWLDAEGDGDLDLFVANYVQWTRTHEIFTSIDGRNKVFATPDRYAGLPCRLYVQGPSGHFVDATESAGLLALRGRALGLAVWDFDGDGLSEVVVANDTQPNFFFFNRSQGAEPRFVERAAELAIAYDENGRARAGMGIDVGVLGQDPDPYVAIGNFTGESVSLFHYTPQAFRSLAARAGLWPSTVPSLTFGLLFADCNLDGALDLVLANGHIEPDIQRYRSEQTYAQSMQLFLGRGDGSFADGSALAGEALLVPRVARGLCAGDVDQDGDLDLLLTQNGGPLVLLLNQACAEAGLYSLAVTLRGKTPNTRAIGAQVCLHYGGQKQWRQVQTASSYLSQSTGRLHFGLGAVLGTGQLSIRWPSGKETSHAFSALDRALVIDEP